MEIAEKMFIGSLLLSPDKIVQVADTINSEDFDSEIARKTYLIILGLWSDKKIVDLSAIAMADISLASYASEAISEGVTFGIKDSAKRISIQAKDRRITKCLAGLINDKSTVTSKLDTILKLHNDEMFTESKDPLLKSVLSRFDKYVDGNKKRGLMGVPTGFNFLEEKYIQYVPGHIWTIGGFTSTGKTAMMVQKICNLLSLDPCPSITVISTEMTEQQLIARILSNLTTIHSYRILSGNYYQGEEEQIEEIKEMLSNKNIRIHDDIYTLPDIETVFRKADMQGGVDIGFIDYVQNCIVPSAKNEYQSGSLLAKGIQRLAKKVMATIVCLSQVSNDVGRGNTDQLELKGAGEWAAVSDLGIMLKRKKEEKYGLRYTVKKNRHGALLDHLVEFKSDFSRLESIGPFEK